MSVGCPLSGSCHRCKAKWWPGGRLRQSDTGFVRTNAANHPLATIRQGLHATMMARYSGGVSVAEADGSTDQLGRNEETP